MQRIVRDTFDQANNPARSSGGSAAAAREPETKIRRILTAVAVRAAPIHILSLAALSATLVWLAFSQRFLAEARLLVAWNAGMLTHISASWTIVALLDTHGTRQRASRHSYGSIAIFWVVLIAACASAVAGSMMLHQQHADSLLSRGWHVGLAIATVAQSWLLVQTDFGFRYSARYFEDGRDDEHCLRFRAHSPPDYLDFMLFAFIQGMTSSVSDVEVRSRDMRWLSIVHLSISFVFNLLVLAMVANLIAGSLQT